MGWDSFVWSLVLAAAWMFGKSTNFPNFIWWKWHRIILDTIKYHSVAFYAFIQLSACGFSCFCHGKLIHIHCPVYACLRSDESLRSEMLSLARTLNTRGHYQCVKYQQVGGQLRLKRLIKQDINWPKEVKPHLYFSHRLNTKTNIFVLP